MRSGRLGGTVFFAFPAHPRVPLSFFGYLPVTTPALASPKWKSSFFLGKSRQKVKKGDKKVKKRYKVRVHPKMEKKGDRKR